MWRCAKSDRRSSSAAPSPRTSTGAVPGDGEDHRQIVRRQIPQRIVLGVELAEAEPVRMDVLHLAEFAGVDQFLQLLEGRMEAQHMADHEEARICLGRRHRPLAVGHGQRDRLLDQHVLAGLDRAHGGIGMELRRQRHDDGVDVVAGKQRVRIDGKAILLAGETFRARPVGVGDGMERAERLERADVVRAPVSASKDCYARFHHLPAQEICDGHITARSGELKPGRGCRRQGDLPRGAVMAWRVLEA